MAKAREPRDRIRSLERSLGFFTERGLSRTPNSTLRPEVVRMLMAVDDIKKQYHALSAEELHLSEAFHKACLDLLYQSNSLWPEPGAQQSAPTDPDFYPRPLAYLDEADRPIITRLFRQLVIEKCVTYQRNQAAKPYRERRSAEARKMKHGGKFPNRHARVTSARAYLRSSSPTTCSSDELDKAKMLPESESESDHDSDSDSDSDRNSDNDTAYHDTDNETYAEEAPIMLQTRQSPRKPTLFRRQLTPAECVSSRKRQKREHEMMGEPPTKRLYQKAPLRECAEPATFSERRIDIYNEVRLASTCTTASMPDDDLLVRLSIPPDRLETVVHSAVATQGIDTINGVGDTGAGAPADTVQLLSGSELTSQADDYGDLCGRNKFCHEDTGDKRVSPHRQPSDSSTAVTAPADSGLLGPMLEGFPFSGFENALAGLPDPRSEPGNTVPASNHANAVQQDTNDDHTNREATMQACEPSEIDRKHQSHVHWQGDHLDLMHAETSTTSIASVPESPATSHPRGSIALPPLSKDGPVLHKHRNATTGEQLTKKSQPFPENGASTPTEIHIISGQSQRTVAPRTPMPQQSTVHDQQQTAVRANITDASVHAEDYPAITTDEQGSSLEDSDSVPIATQSVTLEEEFTHSRALLRTPTSPNIVQSKTSSPRSFATIDVSGVVGACERSDTQPPSVTSAKRDCRKSDSGYTRTVDNPTQGTTSPVVGIIVATPGSSQHEIASADPLDPQTANTLIEVSSAQASSSAIAKPKAHASLSGTRPSPNSRSRVGVRQIQRRLGYDVEPTLLQRNPHRRQLESAIRNIKSNHEHRKAKELKDDAAFRAECDSTFELYAPRIWMGHTAAMHKNSYTSSYRRALSYTVEGDRKRLRNLFYQLVSAKCQVKRQDWLNKRSQMKRGAAKVASKKAREMDEDNTTVHAAAAVASASANDGVGASGVALATDKCPSGDGVQSPLSSDGDDFPELSPTPQDAAAYSDADDHDYLPPNTSRVIPDDDDNENARQAAHSERSTARRVARKRVRAPHQEANVEDIIHDVEDDAAPAAQSNVGTAILETTPPCQFVHRTSPSRPWDGDPTKKKAHKSAVFWTDSQPRGAYGKNQERETSVPPSQTRDGDGTTVGLSTTSSVTLRPLMATTSYPTGHHLGDQADDEAGSAFVHDGSLGGQASEHVESGFNLLLPQDESREDNTINDDFDRGDSSIIHHDKDGGLVSLRESLLHGSIETGHQTTAVAPGRSEGGGPEKRHGNEHEERQDYIGFDEFVDQPMAAKTACMISTETHAPLGGSQVRRGVDEERRGYRCCSSNPTDAASGTDGDCTTSATSSGRAEGPNGRRLNVLVPASMGESITPAAKPNVPISATINGLETPQIMPAAAVESSDSQKDVEHQSNLSLAPTPADKLSMGLLSSDIFDSSMLNEGNTPAVIELADTANPTAPFELQTAVSRGATQTNTISPTSTPMLPDVKLMLPSNSSVEEVTPPPCTRPVANSMREGSKSYNMPSMATDTNHMIMVDWKYTADLSATVSRLTRYSPNLWQTIKDDMPASFSGKRLAGIKRDTISMSAANVLDQYGESIATEGMEDCVQFLMDEAFGENGDVERVWRKATVTMKD